MSEQFGNEKLLADTDIAGKAVVNFMDLARRNGGFDNQTVGIVLPVCEYSRYFFLPALDDAHTDLINADFSVLTMLGFNNGFDDRRVSSWAKSLPNSIYFSGPSTTDYPSSLAQTEEKYNRIVKIKQPFHPQNSGKKSMLFETIGYLERMTMVCVLQDILSSWILTAILVAC